jgi:hypothetical protein
MAMGPEGGGSAQELAIVAIVTVARSVGLLDGGDGGKKGTAQGTAR